MTTKITIIIDNPSDPIAFEKNYQDLPSLAQNIPKLQRLEAAKVCPKEDGTPTPAYRTLDLYFDNYGDASAAVEARAKDGFFHRLATIGAPFIGLFTKIEQE